MPWDPFVWPWIIEPTLSPTTSPYETGGTSFANRSGTETHISAAATRPAYAENEDNATGEIRLSFELWTGEWAGLRRRPLGQVVRRTEHGPFGCPAGRPRHRTVLVQHEADGDQAAQAAEVLSRRKQDKILMARSVFGDRTNSEWMNASPLRGESADWDCSETKKCEGWWFSSSADKYDKLLSVLCSVRVCAKKAFGTYRAAAVHPRC